MVSGGEKEREGGEGGEGEEEERVGGSSLQSIFLSLPQLFKKRM